jgi:hypothetical protein
MDTTKRRFASTRRQDEALPAFRALAILPCASVTRTLKCPQTKTQRVWSFYDRLIRQVLHILPLLGLALGPGKNHVEGNLHQRVLNFLVQPGNGLLSPFLDVFDELMQLSMHFLHPPSHVQDDFDPCKVDSKIAGIEDQLQPFQILLCI